MRDEDHFGNVLYGEAGCDSAGIGFLWAESRHDISLLSLPTLLPLSFRLSRRSSGQKPLSFSAGQIRLQVGSIDGTEIAGRI